jgi:hypothetical protein
VAATLRGVPLTRQEQAAAQTLSNAYVMEELDRAQANPKWDDPTTRTQLARDALSKARERAATEVLRDIPKDEQQDRIRQANQRKAS